MSYLSYDIHVMPDIHVMWLSAHTLTSMSRYDALRYPNEINNLRFHARPL